MLDSDIKGKDSKLDKYVSKFKNYSINKEKLKNKIDADPVILYTDSDGLSYLKFSTISSTCSVGI